MLVKHVDCMQSPTAHFKLYQNCSGTLAKSTLSTIGPPGPGLSRVTFMKQSIITLKCAYLENLALANGK